MCGFHLFLTSYEKKRREGNPGGRKLPARSKTHALSPVDGIPPVPITLHAPGRAFWDRIWTSEGRAWVSPSVDVFKVEEACRLEDLIVRFDEMIDAEPLVREPIFHPKSGAEVATRWRLNPAELGARHARELKLSILSELGFDPAARSRLGLAEVKRDALLGDLFDRTRRNNAKGTGVVREEDIESDIRDAEIVDLAPDGPS